ncbi:outer membrane lipoprotein carrier protein LolA, partial [Pseudomonas syringae pv. tagetis]
MLLISMLFDTAMSFSVMSAHADCMDVARLHQFVVKSQTLPERFSQLTLHGGGTQLQE